MELKAHVSLETSFWKVSDFSPMYSSALYPFSRHQRILAVQVTQFSAPLGSSTSRTHLVLHYSQPPQQVWYLTTAMSRLTFNFQRVTSAGNWWIRGVPAPMRPSEHQIESMITQNIAIPRPSKLKFELKKTWPPKFLLSLPTPHHPITLVQHIDPEHLLWYTWLWFTRPGLKCHNSSRDVQNFHGPFTARAHDCP
jgi:hypothetical protein